MDKKSSFRINNRKETTFGIAAVVLGVMSFLLFGTAVYQSAYHLRGREALIGSIELLAILCALIGLIFGIIGETREDKFKRSAHIGILLNLLVGIFHVIVLIQGY